MGALTEVEIFDCLVTNLRTAAELADDLARLPLKGIAYDRFRKALRLAEGACKQASTWREDTRWLDFAPMLAKCHQMAGDWLRGFKMPDGSRRKMREGELHPCFVKLADNLRGLLALAERTRTARTGRMGMILPTPQEGPHRDTKPIGWTRTASGLVVPSGAAMQ
jgi:hypothetical protein